MMTKEEVVERGLNARRLLEDEKLMSFFRELEGDIKTASFTRPSTDAAERESVYFQLKGIADVFNMMQSYAKAAEDIIDSLNEEPENTYDD